MAYSRRARKRGRAKRRRSKSKKDPIQALLYQQQLQNMVDWPLGERERAAEIAAKSRYRIIKAAAKSMACVGHNPRRLVEECV